MNTQVRLIDFAPFLADNSVGWPSALVALALIFLIGILMGIALLKHSIDEAMKLWGGLGVVVGIMTGSFGTYFFTRQAVEAGRDAAQAKIAAVQGERDRAIAEAATLKLADPTVFKLQPGKEIQAVLIPNKKDETQPQ